MPRDLLTDPQILVDDGVISQAYLDGLDAKSRAFFRVPRSYYTMALEDWKKSGGVELYSEQDKKTPANTIMRYIVARQWTYPEGADTDPQQQNSFSPAGLHVGALVGGLHKYKESGQLLLYASPTCSGFCAEVCFRQQLLNPAERAPDKTAILKHVGQVSEYIRHYNSEHPATPISDVILSGGDPLVLPTPLLEEMINAFCTAMRQSGVKNPSIRIGSKEIVFNPQRITGDADFIPMLQRMQEKHHANFNFMLHITHPSEITAPVHESLKALRRSGCVSMYNQTPVVKGVNCDAGILRELCDSLQHEGVQPYYFFHPRDTKDKEWVKHAPPIADLHALLEKVRSQLGGTKQFTEAGSTEYGKFEVVGVAHDAALNEKFGHPHNMQVITLRLLRSPDPKKTGAMVRAFCDGTETWFSDFFTPQKLIDDPEKAIVNIASLQRRDTPRSRINVDSTCTEIGRGRGLRL